MLRRMQREIAHYGSGVRRPEQIRKWFTPAEMLRLRILGYQFVAMEVDRVLAESKHQLVFKRTKPLNEDIEVLDFEYTAETEG